MNLFKISIAYIRRRKLSTLLNSLLLALGTATIVVLLLFSGQFENNLNRNIQGIDLVIGAKGSPLQLILSGVFHVDSPTGNISLAEARTVAGNRAVAQAIPLALGDRYRGYRIVGTTRAYPAHYGAQLAEGVYWNAPLELTIGYRVARETGLKVGSTVISVHGLTSAPTAHAHGDRPMRVVGILRPTGTVVDRLLLTGVETVWEVHKTQDETAEHTPEEHDDEEHGHDRVHEEGHSEYEEHAVQNLTGRDSVEHDVFGLPLHPEEDEAREITTVLIRYASPLAAVSFPRYINRETTLQAASPAFEATRLFTVLGVGLGAVRAFGAILILAAALGVFVALYNALKDRRYDFAMMRTLGASRNLLVAHVLLEGILLTLMGTVAGLALGHIATGVLGAWAQEARQMYLTGWFWTPGELWLVGLAVVLGCLSALIPAVQVYRTDVAATLTEE